MKLSFSDRAWLDKVLRAVSAAEAGPSEGDLIVAPNLRCGRRHLDAQTLSHQQSEASLLDDAGTCGFHRAACRPVRKGRRGDPGRIPAMYRARSSWVILAEVGIWGVARHIVCVADMNIVLELCIRHATTLAFLNYLSIVLGLWPKTSFSIAPISRDTSPIT